jgi:hypothetical protein
VQPRPRSTTQIASSPTAMATGLAFGGKSTEASTDSVSGLKRDTTSFPSTFWTNHSPPAPGATFGKITSLELLGPGQPPTGSP